MWLMSCQCDTDESGRDICPCSTAFSLPDNSNNGLGSVSVNEEVSGSFSSLPEFPYCCSLPFFLFCPSVLLSTAAISGQGLGESGKSDPKSQTAHTTLSSSLLLLPKGDLCSLALDSCLQPWDFVCPKEDLKVRATKSQSPFCHLLTGLNVSLDVFCIQHTHTLLISQHCSKGPVAAQKWYVEWLWLLLGMKKLHCSRRQSTQESQGFPLIH